MPSYRLHYFPESGNCYKLALMLTLCGQTFEKVWTDFGSGVTRMPEWRTAVNEMGEIPVLEEDGQRFTQSADAWKMSLAYAREMAVSERRHVKLFRSGRNQAVRIPAGFELRQACR